MTTSTSGFKLPKSTVEEETTDKKKTDLIDTFICHLISGYSIFLHVVVDLGFGLFLVNKVTVLF